MESFKIWAFDTAPGVYRRCFIEGGDPKWLIVLPKGMTVADLPLEIERVIKSLADNDSQWYIASDSRRVVVIFHNDSLEEESWLPVNDNKSREKMQARSIDPQMPSARLP